MNTVDELLAELAWWRAHGPVPVRSWHYRCRPEVMVPWLPGRPYCPECVEVWPCAVIRHLNEQETP